MKKENNILPNDFLDFEVFAVPDKNSTLLNTKNVAQKEILVLYFNENNVEELEVLLKNILSATNLDFDSKFSLIKITSDQTFSSSDIFEKLSPKDLIFFGINPTNFGINYNLNLYQPQKVKQRRFLLIDSLHEINTDVKKKKALWSCLKEMYLQNTSK